MNKNKLLFSAITGLGLTLGLLGCSSDGVNEQLESQTQTVPARMVPIYAPSTGSLPLPNDLLFGGTTDLTLNIPVADPTDYSDPAVALSGIDGWSAVAPFAINFSSRDNSLSLDASSVVGGSTIRVFKVNTLRPAVAPGIPAPTGPVTSVERELTYGLEYVVSVTGATSLAIIPTVPFEQQAGYMVILTNGLTDSDGQPLLHDSQYAIVQHPAPIDPASSVAALEPVRQLVNAMETAASSFDGGPARSSIILSYQFTIQSVGSVMRSAKQLYVDGAIAQGLAANVLPATSFTSLGTDTTPLTNIGAADLYKGQITLNYLLSAPTAENPIAPLNTFWKALVQLPIGPGGSLVPNPFGSNLSYANSYPRANGQETVPLLVSMPKESLGCAKPVGGYPVTIFMHGIRQNRTNMIGVADGQAAPPSCRAVIALDQPLHGLDDSAPLGLFAGYTPGGLRERTFGVDYVNNVTGAPGPDGVVDGSGTHYINLGNLLVGRDNAKQAVLDLLYLEQAVAYMDVDGTPGFDFDGSNVTFIGHSLGALNGTGLVAYSGTNQYLVGGVENVTPIIKAAALSNPGGGVVGQLVGSPSLGPTVLAGLSAAFGAAQGTPEFEATLASYMFAAQTVLDSSDPVNMAANALTNGVPTLVLQNLGDSVIPNSLATAPLSGTEPLARALGLTVTAAEDPGFVAGSRLFTKLNVGAHASLLIPDVATAEMQTQIGSFHATGGAGVVVTDPSLLDD